MADETNVTSNSQEPTVPELHVPVGSDYRTMKVDIPLEQPMIFYLDGSKDFYLPHESTDDEHIHNLPQGVVDTLTNKRIFQEISIRQGQSGMFNSPMLFLTKNGPVDMTNCLIRFEGTDAGGSAIFDDEGFNRVQANLGRITWSPAAEVAQTSGYYKNCHFVIESPDRSRIYTTLDFSLNVIANDIAYPRAMAFYVSEYTRALYHIKEMQQSADHQLSYLLNTYAAIIADNLAWVKKTMQDAIDELNKNLDAGNKSINTYISQSDEKLATLNTGIDTAQTRMDALDKKIGDDDLVTKAGLNTAVQLGINTGEIDVNINDVILDKDISSKVDLLTGIIEGSND
ncbi:MAG TPA: phage baseplate upper protein [Candidatus Companilactobacillus pullicola]|uniref:Phage baseplate upper protein n=1 Tax=Candidatus Companilactobacillus pullicola TaxID=2838523 RepID=A0A9D1ZLD3_9LACO|nr:phage baseplate upper protein [Candidatus Companilactobacillus pullicola]